MKDERVLNVDRNATFRILYLEDNAMAATFENRIKRQNYSVDSAYNVGQAWGWLEEKPSYDAIILDLDLGNNQDIYFEDEEDKQAVLNGQFAGYVFHKSVICKKFLEYRDKVLFVTAYHNSFKKSLNDLSEFNSLKDKLIDKREVDFEEKIFERLSLIHSSAAENGILS